MNLGIIASYTDWNRFHKDYVYGGSMQSRYQRRKDPINDLIYCFFASPVKKIS